MGDASEPQEVSVVAEEPLAPVPSLQRPPVASHRVALFPLQYTWYVFLAVLDVVFTYLIVHPDLFVNGLDPSDPDDLLGLTPRGREANPLADWILHRWGIPGMAIFKFVIVLLVIGICEVVGRRQLDLGRKLATAAVVLSALPVFVALFYFIGELTSTY